MSCSTINFISPSGKSYEVIQDKKTVESDMKKVNLTKPFYFWGLMPAMETVDLDSELRLLGSQSLDDLKILEVNKLKKSLWFTMTLGFYYPRSYEVFGYQAI